MMSPIAPPSCASGRVTARRVSRPETGDQGQKDAAAVEKIPAQIGRHPAFQPVHGDGYRSGADDLADPVVVGLVLLRGKEGLDEPGRVLGAAVAFQAAEVGGKGLQVAEDRLSRHLGDGVFLPQSRGAPELFQHPGLVGIGGVLRIAVAVGDLADAIIEICGDQLADAVRGDHRDQAVALGGELNLAVLELPGEVLAGLDRLKGDDPRFFHRLFDGHRPLLAVVEPGGEGKKDQQNAGNGQVDFGEQPEGAKRGHRQPVLKGKTRNSLAANRGFASRADRRLRRSARGTA